MLHDWMSGAATDEDRTILQDVLDSVGAIVMGRRSFDNTVGEDGWGDRGPIGDTSRCTAPRSCSSRSGSGLSTRSACMWSRPDRRRHLAVRHARRIDHAPAHRRAGHARGDPPRVSRGPLRPALPCAGRRRPLRRPPTALGPAAD
jgi:hypothetical protein